MAKLRTVKLTDEEKMKLREFKKTVTKAYIVTNVHPFPFATPDKASFEDYIQNQGLGSFFGYPFSREPTKVLIDGPVTHIVGQSFILNKARVEQKDETDV